MELFETCYCCGAPAFNEPKRTGIGTTEMFLCDECTGTVITAKGLICLTHGKEQLHDVINHEIARWPRKSKISGRKIWGSKFEMEK